MELLISLCLPCCLMQADVFCLFLATDLCGLKTQILEGEIVFAESRREMGLGTKETLGN